MQLSGSGSSLVRVVLRMALVLLVGAAAGFAIEWLVSLGSMRLKGAGYTGVEPHWDLGYATLSGFRHGVPFGAVMAVLMERLLLAPLPLRDLRTRAPILFTATLLGALPGLAIDPGHVFTATVAFVASVVWVRWRWQSHR